MIDGKTFYQILGLLPDAEDIVIKAAYRSLSQKYHPDKWEGDSNFAQKRMSEINLAYEVLSDDSKRAIYDRELKATGKSNAYSDESQEEFDEFLEETASDWQLAAEYFPIIEKQYTHLRRINIALAVAYREYLLAEKAFKKATAVFDSLKEKFLTRYFGSNPSIHKFAERLIIENKKRAALELNRVVSVLGSSVEADQLIQKITREHLTSAKEKEWQASHLKHLIENLVAWGDDNAAYEIIRLLGGEVRKSGGILNREIFVSLDGEEYQFRATRDFMDFVIKRVINVG